jgi:hypothetical protein
MLWQIFAETTFATCPLCNSWTRLVEEICQQSVPTHYQTVATSSSSCDFPDKMIALVTERPLISSHIRSLRKYRASSTKLEKNEAASNAQQASSVYCEPRAPYMEWSTSLRSTKLSMIIAHCIYLNAFFWFEGTSAGKTAAQTSTVSGTQVSQQVTVVTGTVKPAVSSVAVTQQSDKSTTTAALATSSQAATQAVSSGVTVGKAQSQTVQATTVSASSSKNQQVALSVATSTATIKNTASQQTLATGEID